MSAVRRAVLKLMHYSGAGQVLSPWFSGSGVIFMLHHVLPERVDASAFRPNAGLEVTPDHLDDVIRLVKRQGYALVSLEEAAHELRRGVDRGSRFAAFTLDDGYLDNYAHAWPVFRSHTCPFTIFVAPSITDGKCVLWWRVLENVIAASEAIDVEIDGRRHAGSVATDAEKYAMFDRLYWPLRRMGEHEQRAWTRALGKRHGIDVEGHCRDVAMTWDQVRCINSDKLCSIGAHTINHYALKKLPAAEARREIVESRDRLEKELGEAPATFAYPYGDDTSAGRREFDLAREAGFAAAVTTRKGLIFQEHKDHLTALPRLSLNGAYQERALTEVLLTGAPFAIFNKAQRVVVN